MKTSTKSMKCTQSPAVFNPHRMLILLIMTLLFCGWSINAQAQNHTDAGIVSIASPTTTFCQTTEGIQVNLKNYGTYTLDSVRINWSVNKIVQTTYKWIGGMKKDSVYLLSFGSYSFPVGMDTIVAWTSFPNGIKDSFPKNDSASVIVKVLASPTPYTCGNKTICSGISVSLGTTTLSGNKYSWTSSPSGFTSTSSNPTVTPSSTITYTLTQTNGTTGCSASASAKISVNPSPTTSAGGNQGICA